MEYLQVRQAPAFVAHVAGHDAQALGLDLPLAGREEYVSPNERVPLPVKEGREYQPIAVRIISHQLAQLTEQQPASAARPQHKAELARVLDSLLQE